MRSRPRSRQQYVARPLSKGMIRDRPGQDIEDGGFYTLKNAVSEPLGILRRPGFQPTAGGDQTIDAANGYDGNQIGTCVLWRTGDKQATFIITDQMVWSVGITGFTLVPCEVEVDSDYASSDNVTWDNVGADFVDSTTGLDNASANGDVLSITGLGTSKISSVTDDDTVVVASALGSGSQSGKSGAIQQSLRLQNESRVPDWTTAFGAMYVASINQVVLESKYSGGWILQRLGTDSTVSTIQSQKWSCGSLGFFNERMWYGDTYEYDGSGMVEYRQRLRYSVAGNPANVADSAYIDLDYTSGIIQRIIPLGNLLAVYLNTTIYLGRPNNISNLPLTFDEVESGPVGLIGQRAIVPFRDGHFFVGPDNIYYHSTRGLEPIGTPVLEETIRQCSYTQRIVGCIDEKNNRVLFGFPGSTKNIEKVWSFDYLTSSWSYEAYQGTCYMIDNTYLDLSRTIDSMTTGTIDTMSTNYATTIDTLGSENILKNILVRERQGYLDMADKSYSADEDGTISLVVETKDHDLGKPEMQKNWNRMSVKLEFPEDVPFESPLDFAVEISHNRGVTWKSVGNLRIRAGMDEGHIDFRAISPHIRCRLTSNADVKSYWLTEYSLYWSPSGPETSLGTQQG